MPYTSYNRPLSQVGFRMMRQTHPAHAAALSGIGSLGDDSATLANVGFSSAQISQILSAYQSGALSDGGYQALVSGFVDPSQLEDFLAADPGAAATSGAASVAGIPTGASLVYQATIGAQLFTNPSTRLGAIAGALANSGIQVVGTSSSAAGLSAVTVQLQLEISGAGFAKAQDVQSIVDHAFYVQDGQMPQASSISVTGLPGGTGGAVSAGTIGSSLASFFEQNMTTILLGIAAIVVLPQIARKL